MSTREKRANKAAKTFRSGQSKMAYVFRSGITKGMGENQQLTTSVCAACLSLEDLKDVFDSFIHTGQEL